MINGEKVILDYLLAQSTLTDQTGQRVWVGVEPPETYRIEDGPAVIFSFRGGPPEYASAVLHASGQYLVYGRSEIEANTVYRTLVDLLHDQAFAKVWQSRLEGAGQLLIDPDSKWSYVLAYFEHMIQFSE